MAYIPHGPELPAAFPADFISRAAATEELAKALRPLFPKSMVFIRFDPPWFAADGSFQPEPPPPFRRAAASVQPPDTALVDLTPPEDTILAAMKPKWRYNISLAGKRGVIVSEAGEQGLDVFYRLLTETAARDGIAVHGAGYYRALFEECKSDDGVQPLQIRLYTAAHEGDTLAALVALFRGRQAVYLYGASGDIKRNLMAPYALQWQAMRDAKAFGCEEYDLFGIPPDENPNHPMAGLYRFKTGFGGAIIHRPGSWDFPCKALPYTMFSAAERLRKKSFDKKKLEVRQLV
jgi:lipid II:glycine glycyltransferase (peptidoglycan interpeptide bridge formation enzyme)